MGRSNQQTRTFCDVVREVGALRNLGEIGSYLIKQCQEMLPGPWPMSFMLLSPNKQGYWIVSEKFLEVDGGARGGFLFFGPGCGCPSGRPSAEGNGPLPKEMEAGRAAGS